MSYESNCVTPILIISSHNTSWLIGNYELKILKLKLFPNRINSDWHHTCHTKIKSKYIYYQLVLEKSCVKYAIDHDKTISMKKVI